MEEMETSQLNSITAKHELIDILSSSDDEQDDSLKKTEESKPMITGSANISPDDQLRRQRSRIDEFLRLFTQCRDDLNDLEPEMNIAQKEEWRILTRSITKYVPVAIKDVGSLTGDQSEFNNTYDFRRNPTPNVRRNTYKRKKTKKRKPSTRSTTFNNVQSRFTTTTRPTTTTFVKREQKPKFSASSGSSYSVKKERA